MSATPLFEIGARALGYYGLMASWRRKSDGRWQPSVCITSAGVTDEGVHEPAQSVTISSVAGLIALREVVDEALAGQEITPAQAPQHVLKAEAPAPDATDRGAPVITSPDGGPTGAGQPAAAGPMTVWRYEANCGVHVIREARADGEFEGYIASTWGGENEERARLISTAPELRETLTFAVRFFDQLTPADAERMRKVLDKATGSAS